MRFSLHSAKKNFGKQITTLVVQTKTMAFLTLSSLNRSSFLKGFSKARYLSKARAVSVTEETVIQIPLDTKCLASECRKFYDSQHTSKLILSKFLTRNQHNGNDIANGYVS